MDTPRALIQALERLRSESNPHRREEVLNAGLKEMIQWFSLAARIILQDKIRLPKQTKTFMNKHQDLLQKLADRQIPLPEKRRIILKPGGSGFLGGVMIRSLLRWDGEKTSRGFGLQKKTAPKKKRQPKKKTAPKKKRQPKKKKSSKSPKKVPKLLLKLDTRFITQRRKKPSPVSTPRLSRSPSTSPLSVTTPSSPRTSTPSTPSTPRMPRRWSSSSSCSTCGTRRSSSSCSTCVSTPSSFLSRFSPLRSPITSQLGRTGPISSAANIALQSLNRSLGI